MDGLPFSQISSLSKDKSVNVQAAKVPLFMGLWLNHADKPFQDLNVRKAMQYALNRPEMNRDIFHGLGQIPNSVLMGLHYDAPASVVKPTPTTSAKAKALMAKSGFPHGFSTTLQYPSGYDYYTQMVLLMQQELGAIGIKVKLVEEDPCHDHQQVPGHQVRHDVPVPVVHQRRHRSRRVLGLPGRLVQRPQGFFSNWRDPAIQAMVLKFKATLSDSARAQMWPKIQQALMDQTPVINVMNLPFVNAHAATTCGTDIDALGSDHLEDTWLAVGQEELSAD